MAEHPILFSAPMVRAILDGKKSQTRRVVKPQPPDWLARQLDTGFRVVRHLHENLYGAIAGGGDVKACRAEDTIRCPYGAPGDALWVREGFSFRDYGPLGAPDLDTSECWYWADGNVPTHGNWTRPKPSIHMPRAASRLTLRVLSVRVERLQEIGEEDCLAEGGVQRETLPPDPDNFHPPGSYGFVSGLHPFPQGRIYPRAQEAFAERWDSINAKRAPWESNPWVWVVTFERLSTDDAKSLAVAEAELGRNAR